MKSFRQACRYLDLEAKIIGTDTTELSAALQLCDRQFLVKPVFHRDYARQVNEVIHTEKVDLLIPTVDLDLLIWAQRRARLAKMGCTALISSPRVVRLCQDKRKMFTFLRKNGFDTPLTLSPKQALELAQPNFPYFLKPWDGHASRGNMIVHDREELEFYAQRIPHCLVQEFILGLEHTVDVLVDFDGKVRSVVPRLRIETRGGEVSKGMTVKHPGIIEKCKSLVEALGAGPGVITIQCFLTGSGEIKFIEVNPRFGGGVPLSIKAGANFPRWILQWYLGQAPRISLTGWRNGLTMLRYDDAVWISSGKKS